MTGLGGLVSFPLPPTEVESSESEPSRAAEWGVVASVGGSGPEVSSVAGATAMISLMVMVVSPLGSGTTWTAVLLDCIVFCLSKISSCERCL